MYLWIAREIASDHGWGGFHSSLDKIGRWLMVSGLTSPCLVLECTVYSLLCMEQGIHPLHDPLIWYRLLRDGSCTLAADLANSKFTSLLKCICSLQSIAPCRAPWLKVIYPEGKRNWSPCPHIPSPHSLFSFNPVACKLASILWLSWCCPFTFHLLLVDDVTAYLAPKLFAQGLSSP